MKKVGLCLSCRHTNYGTLLQAFATQRVIDGLGYETEILDYSPGIDSRKRYTPGAFLRRNVVKKLFEKQRQKEKQISWQEDELHAKNRMMRSVAADSFREKYLHSFVRCEDFQAARDWSRRYDAVLVGSDQVWNPHVSASQFYTLRFVDNSVKRLSYATSMGVSSWPFYLRGEARSYLSRIDEISVREKTAADIIEGLIGRRPTVVCDPTCLLTREEWESLIPVRASEKPYILCYFLGDCTAGRKLARRMSSQMGLPLWGIMSNERDVDESYLDRLICGAAVEEFVNLIRGASLVITDSFHGTMLSLLHEKPFYVLYRMRTNTQYQRNSRIDDALTRFGAGDRLVVDPENTVSREMDYSTISRAMEEFRSFSLEFLRKSLP